jgi:hypothetical protein
MAWDVWPDIVFSGGLSRHQRFGASRCFHIQGKSSHYNRPRRPRGGVEAQLYSFFNLGARGGGWLTPHRGRFTPGKTRYPLCRRLGGPQSRSGQVRKISPRTGIRSLDRPAGSESLYRLSYPGPLHIQGRRWKQVYSAMLASD